MFAQDKEYKGCSLHCHKKFKVAFPFKMYHLARNFFFKEQKMFFFFH